MKLQEASRAGRAASSPGAPGAGPPARAEGGPQRVERILARLEDRPAVGGDETRDAALMDKDGRRLRRQDAPAREAGRPAGAIQPGASTPAREPREECLGVRRPGDLADAVRGTLS